MVAPIALIAALPELFVAIAALLILYATRQLWVQPLSWIISNLPAAIATVVQAIVDAIGNVAGSAMSWANSEVQALSQLIGALVGAAGMVVGSLVSAAEALAGRIVAGEQVFVSEIGKLIARVETAASVVQQISGRVDVIGQLVAQLEARIAALLATNIPGLIAQSLAEAKAFTTAAVAVAENALRTAISNVESQLATDIAGVTHLVDTTADGIRSWVDQRIGPLVTDLENLKGIIAALPAVATIVWAISKVTELVKINDECVTPACEVISPQLPVLQGLMDAALLALVGSLVADAVSDPQGTATETAGAIGGVESAASELVSVFAGIHL